MQLLTEQQLPMKQLSPEQHTCAEHGAWFCKQELL